MVSWWTRGIMSSTVDAERSRWRLCVSHMMEFAGEIRRCQTIEALENQQRKLVINPLNVIHVEAASLDQVPVGPSQMKKSRLTSKPLKRDSNNVNWTWILSRNQLSESVFINYLKRALCSYEIVMTSFLAHNRSSYRKPYRKRCTIDA